MKKRKPTRKGQRGAPRKVSPAALDRIFELARQGLTHEAIQITLEQEGLATVTRQTVARYLLEAEAKGVEIPRRRRADPRRQAFVQTFAARAIEDAEVPADADLETVEGVAALLQRVDGAIRKAEQNQNITTFAQLCRLRVDLTAKHEAMKPPPPPDPNSDPMYVKARQRLVAKFKYLVEQHEAAAAT